MDRYLRVERIGEGTYGVVYKAKDLKSNKIVALKRIRLASEEDDGLPPSAIREISILKEFNHPNIVKLLNVVISENTLNLIFEYLEKDLKRYMMDQKSSGGLDLATVKSFLYQLLTGIAYCHQNQVLHRDLKPPNLLISSEGELKIADFGLARAVGIPVRNITSEVVTLWYRPPDVLLGSKKYSSTVDIWSVGCIFAEMVNGTPIFHGSNEEKQLDAIFQGLGTPPFQELPGLEESSYAYNIYPAQSSLQYLVPSLDDYGVHLLTMMLQFNPARRSSANELLQHPFFADVVLPESVAAANASAVNTAQSKSSSSGSGSKERSYK